MYFGQTYVGNRCIAGLRSAPLLTGSFGKKWLTLEDPYR
jgi:hypothetical protein